MDKDKQKKKKPPKLSVYATNAFSQKEKKNPPLASYTQSFPFFPFLSFTSLIIKVGEYTYVHTYMYPYAPHGPATPFSKIHRAEVFR